jgi:ribosomal protein L34E
MFTDRMSLVHSLFAVSRQSGQQIRDEEGPVIELPAQDCATNHRGRYILERGTWRATCADCGWSVEGTTRRRAATIFRSHIQSMRPSEPDPTRAARRSARAV